MEVLIAIIVGVLMWLFGMTEDKAAPIAAVIVVVIILLTQSDD